MDTARIYQAVANTFNAFPDDTTVNNAVNVSTALALTFAWCQPI